MKYSDFTRLCHEEWMKEYRGDVTGLRLTRDTAIELELDMIWTGNLPYPAYLTTDNVQAVREGVPGALLTTLQNPVTRSAVQVILDADQDIAIVSHGQLGEPEELVL